MRPLSGVEVVAICDLLPEARAKFVERWGATWPGMTVYDDAAALIAQESLDAADPHATGFALPGLTITVHTDVVREKQKTNIRTPDGEEGFWVIEQKAGHVHWQEVNSLVRPGVIRLFTYQLISRGATGVLRGAWHAHVGWLFIHTHRGNKKRYAPDLLDDPLGRDGQLCDALVPLGDRPDLVVGDPVGSHLRWRQVRCDVHRDLLQARRIRVVREWLLQTVASQQSLLLNG